MPRRVLEGRVTSAANNKTITVEVERRFMHPLYKKYVRKNDKYAAHDENNSCQVGDLVQIIECRPISKSKRWTLVDGDQANDSKPADKKEVAKKVEPKKEAAKKDEKKPAAKKPAAKKKTTAKKDTKKD